MTVDPINTGPVQPSRTGKPADTEAAERPETKKKHAQAVPDAVKDKVEFSSAAQELHELAGAGEIDTNTIPPERLRQILARMEEGFYDRPEVMDEIVRRASEEP